MDNAHRDKPLINLIHFSDFADFIQSISYNGKLHNIIYVNNHIFRGVSVEDYELLPKSHRIDELHSISSQILSEFETIMRFYEISDLSGLQVPECYLRYSIKQIVYLANKMPYADKEYWPSEDIIPVAALAQHHGLPTRLLDWTYSFFIALYFSASGALKKLNKDNIKRLNFAVYILNMQELKVASMLYERSGNFFPFKIINPPYGTNEYLSAQRGLFTYWQENTRATKNNTDEMNRLPLNERLDHFLKINSLNRDVKFHKIIIPYEFTTRIIRYCFSNDFNAARLFPDYNGVVKHMEEEKRLNAAEAEIML